MAVAPARRAARPAASRARWPGVGAQQRRRSSGAVVGIAPAARAPVAPQPGRRCPERPGDPDGVPGPGPAATHGVPGARAGDGHGHDQSRRRWSGRPRRSGTDTPRRPRPDPRRARSRSVPGGPATVTTACPGSPPMAATSLTEAVMAFQPRSSRPVRVRSACTPATTVSAASRSDTRPAWAGRRRRRRSTPRLDPGGRAGRPDGRDGRELACHLNSPVKR